MNLVGTVVKLFGFFAIQFCDTKLLVKNGSPGHGNPSLLVSQIWDFPPPFGHRLPGFDGFPLNERT